MAANASDCERPFANHRPRGAQPPAQGTKVLLRAHGEPPATYELARERGICIIDATCPVVLQLQRRIKKVYTENPHPQIVIYGKRGHAEVLGLVGQTNGEALVIESVEEAAQIDFSRPVALFSQTTKPLEVFRQIVDYITAHMERLKIFATSTPFAARWPTACQTFAPLPHATT